jgi:hypothetical protein
MQGTMLWRSRHQGMMLDEEGLKSKGNWRQEKYSSFRVKKRSAATTGQLWSKIGELL